MNKLSKIVLGLAVSVAMVSCDPMGIEGTPSTPGSDAGVTPVIVDSNNQGGNVTCAEIGTFELSSERVNYEGGAFDKAFPAGFEVTVTDGKYVSWSYTAPDMNSCLGDVAVIVKGSAAANVYYYEGGVTSDSGLASPVNASGGSAGLSNLTFCFNLVPCEDNPPVECSEETAFGGDSAGAGSGWWFAYDTAEGGQQAIYAGQKLVEGAYVEVVDGVLTIELGANMKLQDVTCEEKTNKKGVTTTSCSNEQVKVQAYDMLPGSRPAAGLFTTYKGRDLSGIEVGSAAYVVIHLDVEVCE
jgi:hypothetical protein